MQEHHLVVSRTARYYTVGPQDGTVREVWFVLHGQGQLAGRFIRHFEALDDGSRLIVAPEALSRSYVSGAPPADGGPLRVGATWMTRDDRESEISDYVGYLDALYASIFVRVPREGARVTVLGFSQGAATASRWVALGAARAERLICWGGALAHDVALGHAGGGLRGAVLTLVVGTEDEHATPHVVAAEEARLAAQGVPYATRRFTGGHRLDGETLAAVAAE